MKRMNNYIRHSLLKDILEILWDVINKNEVIKYEIEKPTKNKEYNEKRIKDKIDKTTRIQ